MVEIFKVGKTGLVQALGVDPAVIQLILFRAVKT
jgi:hypothetical protein